MRHVKYNPAEITYPPDWEDNAAAARRDVELADPDNRSAEINKPKHRELWSSLKPELAKIMYGKCWYTEAPQVGTDTDVDHYRPKNAVKGVHKAGTKEKHPGYWWYAFDPSNYRYSCIVANRLRRDIETGLVGGKADEFPLWKEEQRSWCPDDDCENEQPLLIDPCKASEVALITFGENGEATARHSEDKMPRLFARADRSIKLYHLNHSDFVKARIAIRDDIVTHIQLARRCYKRLNSGSPDTENGYEHAIAHLRAVCSEKAPFSSFAIAFLAPYREDESLAGVFS